MSFDDSDMLISADLSDEDARAYEEKVLQIVQEWLPPGVGWPLPIRSVELLGRRPDTRVVFKYTDVRRNRECAGGYPIWRDRFDVWAPDVIDHPVVVAGYADAARTAHELEPVDPGEPPSHSTTGNG